jgi:hypothetical protein
VTIPRSLASAPQRVSDYVRGRIAALRNPLSTDELNLAAHLRGNELLYTALTRLIESRIRGRAKLPVPSDPLVCKSMLERDNECRWLLSRLDTSYHALVSNPADEGEQPPR